MKLEREKLEKKYPVILVNLIMNSTALFFILISPFIIIYRLFKFGGVKIK